MDAESGRRRMRVKSLINLMLVILFSAALMVTLNLIQNGTSRRHSREDSLRILDEIADSYTENHRLARQMTRIYHNGNRESLEDLKRMFEDGLFDRYVEEDPAVRAEQFGQIMERADVKYLFVMNGSGEVLLAAEQEAAGTSLVEAGLLTEEQVTSLKAGRTVYCSGERGSFYFYATPVTGSSGTYWLVLGEKSQILDAQCAALTDFDSLIGQTAGTEKDFVFAADAGTRTLVYCRAGDIDLTGRTIDECGLTEAVLRDGSDGIQRIGGKEYYCVTRLTEETVCITSAVAVDSLYAGNFRVVFWSAALFLMTAFLCLAYAVIVRNDLIHQRTRPELKPLFRLPSGTRLLYNRSAGRKVLPVMAVGLVVIFAASFYVQTLLSLSGAIAESTETIMDLEGRVEHTEALQKDIREYYEGRFLSRTRLLAYMLEVDPSPLNEGSRRTYSAYAEDGTRQSLRSSDGTALQSIVRSSLLQELCSKNDVEQIFVLDEQGRTIATNTDVWYFTISRDPQDQSYPFLQVLDDRLDELVQEARVDEGGDLNQYIGTTLNYYTTRDDQGNTLYVSLADYESYLAGTWEGKGTVKAHRGMLQTSVSQDVMSSLLDAGSVGSVISQTNIYRSGFIMVFDPSDEHELLYVPENRSFWHNAADVGLDESYFSGDFNGFRRFDGQEYFLSCQGYKGYFFCTAIPTASLYSVRLTVALVTTAVSFITLLIMCALVLITTEKEQQLFEQLTGGVYVDDADPLGSRRGIPGLRTAAEKLGSGWRRWVASPPEKKLSLLLSICGIALTLILLLTLLGIRADFGTGSILRYIISQEWEHRPNIFSLTACGTLMITVTVAVALLRMLIITITSILGTRSETMGKLTMSILKYGSVVASAFYCLYMVGFDAASLFASAGILSVVIGLGAQSIIGDVLAGVFIVFEGAFRVGDIVTIGDFRGTVQEIGLRTTRVMDGLQNVRTFNNSQITSVLNMTKRTSYAVCEIGVSYDQPLEEIELVLKKELPKVRKSIPQLLKDPTYEGVGRFDDSAVVIRIQAECEERSRIRLTRALNREILLIFDRCGVRIPFPHVTITAPEESTDTLTDAQRRTASRYAHEQLAKGEVREPEEEENGETHRT